jgi:hypothetical protein
MPDSHANDHKLNPSELLLPAWVLLRPDGVYINVSPPPAQDIFKAFIERIFSNEARFIGLDYVLFLRLLYRDSSEDAFIGEGPELRLAKSIVRFPVHRQELYKGVKIADNAILAEYMFEPAFIEVTKEEPIYGETDEHGVMSIVDYRRKIEMHAAQLDFDEFVTSMWLKGIRFGIDADAVREVIKSRVSTRLNVALKLDPTISKDAEVVEESDSLRQDNAPLILSNGKADLRRATNRFPQVQKNAPLLRKIPRKLGKRGHLVSGEVIEPNIPKDLDLSKLAGEGTRIEHTDKGEILLATIDGFLVIDSTSGTILITKKIENKGGISVKSTGDISLTVDEFTEHGEVQEGRVVDGRHMTFLSDVYGTINSKKGGIVLEKNLSGGRACSVDGNIMIRGKAINSVLEAWDGTIHAEFAESCSIMGKCVSIGRAVNCEIIAEELQLGISEGCTIAGKYLQIDSSDMRKHRETIIFILVPDIARFDLQIAEIKVSLLQVEQALEAENKQLGQNQSDPGFAKYLLIAEKIRTGGLTLTPEQQVGWQKMVNQYAPLLNNKAKLIKKRESMEQAIEQWVQERANCHTGEYCKIVNVSGDTVVRKFASANGVSAFKKLSQPELKAKLQGLNIAQDQIFSDHKGSLDWHFIIPDHAATTI